MGYRIEWEQDAANALEKLDVQITRDILKRIRWLSANFDKLQPKALTGRFKGYFKLRVGDYRVVYSVNYRHEKLIIRIVGHRSRVYYE